MSTWHPNARKVIISTAPQNLSYVGGGRKMVWHTTEGSSIEGAESAYHANGDCPHFTIAMVNGNRVLHQHLPLEVAASALRHPSGTQPTNTANAIQVEIVGFARDSGSWPKAKYHFLHMLALYVRVHFRVPLSEAVDWRNPKRFTEHGFVEYAGHCGHMHVPNNDHVDPGHGFHIGYVLGDVT